MWEGWSWWSIVREREGVERYGMEWMDGGGHKGTLDVVRTNLASSILSTDTRLIHFGVSGTYLVEYHP